MTYRTPPHDAPFRRDKKTVDEARADGFATGSDWDAPWTPGGPYVYSFNQWEHPDLLAYAKLTKDRNTAWREGFQMARKLIAGDIR